MRFERSSFVNLQLQPTVFVTNARIIGINQASSVFGEKPNFTSDSALGSSNAGENNKNNFRLI